MLNEDLALSTGRALAKHLRRAFGGTPRVFRCSSADNANAVDLLCCKDAPQEGVSSYSTLNLWQLVPEHQGPSGPFSTEIVGACSTGACEFSNVIGNIAFNSMDSAPVWPGTFHENIVAEYYPTANCRHCVLGYPFLWGDAVPKPLVIEGRGHHWLQAIPITDAEAQYLRENGYDALENLFVDAQIDVFNLNRACALVERED